MQGFSVTCRGPLEIHDFFYAQVDDRNACVCCSHAKNEPFSLCHCRVGGNLYETLQLGLSASLTGCSSWLVRACGISACWHCWHALDCGTQRDGSCSNYGSTCNSTSSCTPVRQIRFPVPQMVVLVSAWQAMSAWLGLFVSHLLCFIRKGISDVVMGGKSTAEFDTANDPDFAVFHGVM